MLNPSAIKSRFNKGVDSYTNYAPSIRVKNDKVYIHKQETYIVDLNTMTCTCRDYEFHGSESPCKHIIIGFIYTYGMLRDGEKDELPF